MINSSRQSAFNKFCNNFPDLSFKFRTHIWMHVKHKKINNDSRNYFTLMAHHMNPEL